MGNNTPFVWTLDHSIAVEKLKVALVENAILHMLQNDKPLILYTDFSILGLGAILSQKITDRNEKVIEFASRTLQKYETHLDSY